MSTEVQPINHLIGQACTECGHEFLAHWRAATSCSRCHCTADPVCKVPGCGQATSKHEHIPADVLERRSKARSKRRESAINKRRKP
jgi:SUMO ligase MMS21 Smc5/6 complex component